MFDQIIESLVASGLSREQALGKISAKKAELSGIVSDEGAAYIVAKELGLPVELHKRLKLSSLQPGLQSVEVVAKLASVGDVREFKTERAEGRVCNLVLFDETGTIRLSLWNDEIDVVGDVAVGDSVRVVGFVKDGFQGRPELRLGRRGTLEKSDINIAVAEPPKQLRSSFSSAQTGDSVRVRAALLQLFESPPFFEVCPQCEKRLVEAAGIFSCPDHGPVEPSHIMRLSGILDDGSSSIRAVFFREAAEALLGISSAEARRIFLNHGISRLISEAPLGEEFVVEGYMKYNSLFSRNEMSVRSVSPVDVKAEIAVYLDK